MITPIPTNPYKLFDFERLKNPIRIKLDQLLAIMEKSLSKEILQNPTNCKKLKRAITARRILNKIKRAKSKAEKIQILEQYFGRNIKKHEIKSILDCLKDTASFLSELHNTKTNCAKTVNGLKARDLIIAIHSAKTDFEKAAVISKKLGKDILPKTQSHLPPAKQDLQ